MIDSASAKSGHFDVGDTIGASVQGPIRSYRSSASRSSARSTRSAGDRRGLRHEDGPAAARQGRLRPDRGLGEAGRLARARSCARSSRSCPPAPRSQTGAEQAKAPPRRTSGVHEVHPVLHARLRGVALFVGAFVIFNTLSITVAQRTRELATLRTLGASRRQVLALGAGRVLAIGVVASALGLVLGVGLAKGLGALMAALDLDLPQTGLVFETRTVVVSMDARDRRHAARRGSPRRSRRRRCRRSRRSARARAAEGRLAPYRAATSLWR